MFRNKNCVAIVGRIPPPYGGVTVHIQRFLNLLSIQGVRYVLLDLDGRRHPEVKSLPFQGPFPKLLSMFLFSPCNAFHFHTSKIKFLLWIAFFFRLRSKVKLLFTLHNQTPMFSYKNGGILYRKVFGWLFKRVDRFVVTNTHLRSWLLEEVKVPQENVFISPAFLPVTEGELKFSDFPEEVNRLFSDHTVVIGSQGFFGNFHKGQHVYSFDMIAKLLRRIRKDFPEAGGFTAISGSYSKKHREEILQIRKDYGLEEHWGFLETPCPVAALYQKCSLFVRPTVTDGDSVSVRECLQLEVPVLASDCVQRPEGVTIFPSRNQSAFELLALEVLKNPSSYLADSTRIVEDAKQNVSNLIGYYRSVLD